MISLMPKMDNIKKRKLLSKFKSIQNWNLKLFKKELETCKLDYNDEIEILNQSIKDTKRVYNKIK